jgi:hypothetical protein
VQNLGCLRNAAQPCNGVKGMELLERCDPGKHELILALTNVIVKKFNYSFLTSALKLFFTFDGRSAINVSPTTNPELSR